MLYQGKLEDLRFKQKDVAKLVGISYRTIQRHEEIPRDESGHYPVLGLMSWIQNTDGFGDELDQELKRERIRKLRRENDMAEGYLIDARTQESIVGEIVDVMRSLGDSLARKNQLTGPQAQAMFNAAVQKLSARMDQLANQNQPA